MEPEWGKISKASNEGRRLPSVLIARDLILSSLQIEGDTKYIHYNNGQTVDYVEGFSKLEEKKLLIVKS